MSADTPDTPDVPPIPKGPESPNIPEGESPPKDLKTRQNPKMRRNRRKTSPQMIAIRERQQQALELRKQGYSYVDIAAAVGYKSQQAAWEAVAAAMRRITDEPARAVIRLELERLDRMFAAAYVKACSGDLFAQAACLNIMQRRAKMQGLDVPDKTELTGKDGSPLMSGATGVLVVPGMSDSPDAWAKMMKDYNQQQADAAAAIAAAQGNNGGAG